MKARRPRTAQEDNLITLGLISRWGSIAFVSLAPTLAIAICNHTGAAPEIKRTAIFLSMGIAAILFGLYHIIGTLMEAKHLLVSLQLSYHVSTNKIELHRPWKRKEKREYILIGALSAFIGSALATVALV